MPIISHIGRRSWKIRLVLAGIFTVLILGAVTMVYPLLLMLGGSVRSQADFADPGPLPAYLWDDLILWRKYLESKYSVIREAEKAHRRPLASWRLVQLPRTPEQDQATLVQEYLSFRGQYDWPTQWYSLGHCTFTNLLHKNARLYRQSLQQRFGGNVRAYAKAAGTNEQTWAQIGPPIRGTSYAGRALSLRQGPRYELYEQFKAAAPAADWIVVDLDGVFWGDYLLPKWPNVGAYNAAHGTSYSDYRQVLLNRHPPAGGQARVDWQDYVRHSVNLAFIRVDAAALPAWQRFLSQRYDGKLQQLNVAWNSGYGAWSEVELLSELPQQPRYRVDLAAFIKDPQACDLEHLEVYGPRQAFEEFVARKRGVSVEQVTPLAIPMEAADWADLQANKNAWRWEFVRGNYLAVFDYLLLHGKALRNTVIYCTLAVLAHLLINPLAAYGLSRYQPPSMYTILLFCMATMAFPHEVTMIPAFLLLKKFPLVPIVLGGIAALLAAWVLHQALPRTGSWLKGILAGVVGLLAGAWLAPLLAQKLLGRPDASLSLLNTFWALILPGLANGYSIFLLKGFFDSLPKELYEAADLDGASEWTKFWMLTMSLSKPILAVLGLSAFTHAYSEFMMALVIIPDPNMWTIMVWIFQFQSTAHASAVYASLVVAAIPTLLVFVFCQNLIMRGIVVPTEK